LEERQDSLIGSLKNSLRLKRKLKRQKLIVSGEGKIKPVRASLKILVGIIGAGNAASSS